MVFLVWGGATSIPSFSFSGYSPDLAMLLNISAILLLMTSGLSFSSSAHMLSVPVLLYLYYLYYIYVSTMCIYCDYCVYHYKSTELVSLYTLDIGL